MDGLLQIAKWAAALLALAAAGLGLAFWRSDAQLVKRLGALLALCAAASAFAAIVFERQIDAAAEQWRATPPVLDASFKLSSPNEELVVITTETDVPLECTWVVVTKNDTVVSGIMTESSELHPRAVPGPYRARVDIQPERILDNYLELRLRCESVFYEELGSPDDLRVWKFRAYRRSGRDLTEVDSGDLPTR